MNLLEKVLCLCRTPPIINYNQTTEILTLTSINGLSDTTAIPINNGVTEIVAGIGVTINPTPGVGVVTINAGLSLPPVENEYLNIAQMQASQTYQSESYIQYVADDGTGEEAYYEYLGTTTGTLLTDYRLLTGEEVIIINNNNGIDFMSFILEAVESVPINSVSGGHLSFEYDNISDIVTGVVTNVQYGKEIENLIAKNPLCDYYLRIYNATVPRRQYHLAKITGFETAGLTPGTQFFKRILLETDPSVPVIRRTDGFVKDDKLVIYLDVDNEDTAPAGAINFTDLLDTPAGYGTPGQFVTTDGLGNIVYTSSSITVNYRGVVSPGITNLDSFAPIAVGDWWLSDATGDLDTGATLKGVFEGGVVVANVDMPLVGDVLNTKVDSFVPFNTVPTWQMVLDQNFNVANGDLTMEAVFDTDIGGDGFYMATFTPTFSKGAVIQHNESTWSVGSYGGTDYAFLSLSDGLYALSQGVSGATTSVLFNVPSFNTTLQYPAPSAVGTYNMAIGVRNGAGPVAYAGTDGVLDVAAILAADPHTFQAALEGGEQAISPDSQHRYKFDIDNGTGGTGGYGNAGWSFQNYSLVDGWGTGYTAGSEKGFYAAHRHRSDGSSKVISAGFLGGGYNLFLMNGEEYGFHNKLIVPRNYLETANINVPTPNTNTGLTTDYYLTHSVSNGVVGAPGVVTVEADITGNVDISVLLGAIDAQSLQNALNGGESAVSSTSMHSFARPVIEAVDSGLDYQLQAVGDNRYNARLLMAPDTDGNVYLQHTNTNDNVFGRVQFNRTYVEMFQEQTGGDELRGAFKVEPIPTISYSDRFEGVSVVSFRPLDKMTDLWFPSPSGAADDFTLGIAWAGPTGVAVANDQGTVDLTGIGLGGGGAPAPVPTAGTGSVIDMSNTAGHYMNMGAASGATSYTTSGAVLGGYSVCLINAASITVDGGAADLIPGDTFTPGVDMHMWVQYFGTVVQYYFAALS